jgi:hypothetical protein
MNNTDVLNNRSTSFWDYLIPNMKAPQSFETSAIFHQPTRREIPEELESRNSVAVKTTNPAEKKLL